MQPYLTIRHAIDLSIAIGLLASTCFYLATYFGARLFFRRRGGEESHGGATDLPGVTVLKPLKGLDYDLFENLSTFCRQDYPTFQIVFGVADPDDPVVAVVHRLQASFPGVRIDLVIDGRVWGTNYKISNLQNMYGAAAYDLLVMADSDIRVAPDYLRRITKELADPGVGVVTCVYRAANTGGLPTLIESLFINADFAPSILVARLVETTEYAFGATMALRRSVLDEIGGFPALANYLADDFYLGNRVVARGYRVALADLVVETVLAVGSWKRLVEHQLRWARTHRTCRPASYFALILTQGTLWATLNLLWNGSHPLAWAATLSVYMLRVSTSLVISNRYLHAPLRLREAFLVLPKDLFSSAIWFIAFLGNTVHWSGHQFRVLKSGHMVRLDPLGPPQTALPPYPAVKGAVSTSRRSNLP